MKRHGHRHWLTAFALTAVLILLIATAVSEEVNYFYLVMMAVVAGAVAFFTLLFPASHFFALALANSLGVYTVLFTFVRLTSFPVLPAWAIHVGYAMPVIAFLAGAAWHRRAIRAIVHAADLDDRPPFLRVFTWLVPIVLVTALAFFVPIYGVGPEWEEFLFLGKMAVASVVVLLASRYVAIFLLDAGLLFEGFFSHMGKLFLPAFAFLTFYSLIVIVFACVYRIMDRFSESGLFRILGAAKRITFPEAVYYSVATLSTVGYGDIVPAHDVIRLVSVIEVVMGVLLLLFGVSELVNYARRREREDERHGKR